MAADGTDRGALDVGAITSNCTFGGGWLYVIDFGLDPLDRAGVAAGALWRAEIEAEGVEPYRGRLS